MTTCRSQTELGYITYVVDNWNVGVEVKKMLLSIENNRLTAFRRDHKLGHKYVQQYCTEQIVVPGSHEPRTVLRRSHVATIVAALLLQERTFSQRSMSGIARTATWVRRGPMCIATRSTKILHKTMSGSIVRHASLA
jgi:hypothetical protein